MKLIEVEDESYQEKLGGYSYMESLIYSTYHILDVCDKDEYFFHSSYPKCFSYRYTIML